MLSSLSAAVSGLDNFQQDMDVIGNNIANINTTGFKDATVQLANSFSNTLASATANPIQIGAGVYDEAITNNWSTGSLNSTGNTSDVAINGSGFFQVANASGTYYTQDGAFSVDQSGNLVTSGGLNVQGLTPGGTVGNIQIVPTAAELSAGDSVSSFTINGQGQVTITLSNGTVSANSPQLYLANFNDPQALANQSGNLYSNPLGTTNMVGGAPGVAGTNGTGLIVQGALELSNVDLSTEMANLITAQQGFEANSKVVTTSSQMLQTVISMVQA